MPLIFLTYFLIWIIYIDNTNMNPLSRWGRKKHLQSILIMHICLSQSRVVGGLISTYDLSGDKVFLEKAKDIADRLLPAWNTPSGIPYNIINLAHGNPHNPGWTGVSIHCWNLRKLKGFPIYVNLSWIVKSHLFFCWGNMSSVICTTLLFSMFLRVCGLEMVHIVFIFRVTVSWQILAQSSWNSLLFPKGQGIPNIRRRYPSLCILLH